MKLVLFIMSFLITGNAVGFQVQAIEASGGEDSSLAKFSNDSMYGAGRNIEGQLGIGDNNNANIFTRVLSGEQNLQPNTYLTDILDFDAGWKHSIFVDINGHCYTVGSNIDYALGIGSYLHEDIKTTFVQVLTGEQDPNNAVYLKNIVKVSAGRSGTHSLAIEDHTGRVFSWGNNNKGQLGINTTVNEPIPWIVLTGEQNEDPNSYPYFLDAVEVSGGEFHSMILDSTGSVYCMGRYDLGQLGNNLAPVNNKVPVRVYSGEQSDESDYLDNIIAIDAGWDHCIALEALDPLDDAKNGRVFTWGSNTGAHYGTSGGKLGNGSNTGMAAVPIWVKSGFQQIDPDGLVNIIAVAAGESHCLALDNAGNVWAWGDNIYGQLGIGSSGNSGNSYEPVRVIGGEQGTQYLSNIVEIAAGYWHSIAITDEGQMYVWGWGASGRLGLDDTNNRYYPCKVSNPRSGGGVDISFSYIIKNDNPAVSPVDQDANEFSLTVTVTNPQYGDPNFIGTLENFKLKLYHDPGCYYDPLISWDPFIYDNDYIPQQRLYIWEIEQLAAGSAISKTLDFIVTYNAYPSGELEFKAEVDIDYAFKEAYGYVPVAYWHEIDNGIIYVDSTAANRYGKGTSWLNPFVRLGDAISRAAEDPNNYNEIWVAKGLYYPDIKQTFMIDTDISLYGGFEGNETQKNQRDYINNISRIVGYGSNYVITFNDCEDAVLDGFTVTGGNFAGIYCEYSTPIIQNCVIAGNGVENYSNTYGIRLLHSSPLIADCIIANNAGAGIFSTGGLPLITRTMIKDNGRGIEAAAIEIYNSIISSNAGNGVLITSSAQNRIVNCTIVANEGYAIQGSIGTTAANNILWANNDDGYQYINCDISYSCIYDPNNPQGSPVYDQNYNISADPEFLFTYPAYKNYISVLSSSSPCIDAGSNSFVEPYDTDFYNQDRIHNGIVDMGAVEYPGLFEYIDFDLNKDGIVNYADFSVFAGSWLLEYNEAGYNAQCDWNGDDYIDINDLIMFADAWLWQPPQLKTDSLAAISKYPTAYTPLQAMEIAAPEGGFELMGMSKSIAALPQTSIIAPEEQTLKLGEKSAWQQIQSLAQTIAFLDMMRAEGLLDELTEQQWQSLKSALQVQLNELALP